MIIEKYKLVREWVLNPLSKISKFVNGDESDNIIIQKPVRQYLTKKGFKKVITNDGKTWIWEKLGFTIDINGSFDVDFKIYSNRFLVVFFSKCDSGFIYCGICENVKDNPPSSVIGFVHLWSDQNLTIQELSKTL